MSTPLTLELLQSEFQFWRQHKSSPRSRVPQDLQDKALALRSSVKISQITQALGINTSMIKRRPYCCNIAIPPPLCRYSSYQ
jgi:hypothetical protein